MMLNIKLELPHAQTCTHKHAYPLYVLQHIHTYIYTRENFKREIIMICLILISKQVRML